MSNKMTFGGAEGTPVDKSRLDVKVTEPNSSGQQNTIHPVILEAADAEGVKFGLSAREDIKTQTGVGPTYNYSQDQMTGNYQERPNPYEQDVTVSGKGRSFSIDA